ncbi:hypothetical protein FMEXI_3716 [Fusarium mexicanum]|uniref:C2H2-type domain-containing protein n=1 Tax=Fusarium mexicanum TaxID=751941 RepID=A0A8H5J9A2_9HYPO|nr:hypothetical protein FMEXI_3716 [Fusarium mexicanum]
MHGSTSDEGPSTVESGPSEQPQYPSHNYLPPNSPPGVTQPNLSAYGPNPPVPQYQYPPPPHAPFAAHAYPPPAPFSFYGSGPGNIAAGERSDVVECIFSDIRPASAFVPAPFVPGFVPPKGSTYGPFGEPYVQAQHQNVDVSISDYGASPNSTHDYYPQHRTSGPPPPHHQGGYRGGGYRGRSFQGMTSSLSDRQARGRPDLDSKTFFYTESAVPTNSDTTVDDYDVSETWKSQSSKHPEKAAQTLQDREPQAPLAIPILPLPRGPEPQSPAASPEVLQDHDWKYPNLEELNVRMTKLAESPEELIKLPDPARLRISSTTPSSSPTVSSDIEVYSVSADSEGKLDRNSRGYCVFSRVFSRLAILGQNEVTARGESSSSSSKGKEVSKGVSASSSGTRDAASTRGGRKNRRQVDGNGDESRDKQNEPPKKKGKTSQSRCHERSQFLACPYWKADSKKYWDCFLKKNDTIAHLKQHLTRRHTPKYYCQICYQTFRDFNLFDLHALERSCTRGPSAKLEGISQQQKNQLSLKSKGSVEQQWYTVWSILFPEMEPPATIYIYSTQSEDFCQIQEFAQREGVAIMLEELESNGLVVRPNASNQLLQSTVQRAMVSIFRSYSVRGGQSSEAEEPILSQALEPDNGVSLQQESTTEGPTSHGNHPSSSIDVNRMTEDGRGSSMLESFYRPSRSTESQLPTMTSWLPRAVQDDTEDELWGTAFLEEPAFGESSSGNDLPINFESTDMLDLDAILRDVISTEA